MTDPSDPARRLVRGVQRASTTRREYTDQRFCIEYVRLFPDDYTADELLEMSTYDLVSVARSVYGMPGRWDESLTSGARARALRFIAIASKNA